MLIGGVFFSPIFCCFGCACVSLLARLTLCLFCVCAVVVVVVVCALLLMFFFVVGGVFVLFLC